MTNQITGQPPSTEVRNVLIALVGVLPGGSLAELFINKLWQDPVLEAQRDFLLEVAKRLRALEDRGVIDIQSVLEKPETQPLLNCAFEAVRKSIGERKLQALRDVTVRGIFERVYDFDLSAMVFAMLDRITEGHLRVLQEVAQLASTRGGSYNVALVERNGIPEKSSPDGMMQPVAANLGKSRWYDGHLVRVNNIIISDLESMGILEFKNGQAGGTVALSEKGALFYDMLFGSLPPEVPLAASTVNLGR